jgi:hypothetical protein
MTTGFDSASRFFQLGPAQADADRSRQSEMHVKIIEFVLKRSPLG